MDQEHYKAARKRVKQKKEFYGHLSVYLAVGTFFMLINFMTYAEEPEIWFPYPLIGWGIGILIHYFSVFGLPGVGPLTKEWEERELQKELEKTRNKINREPIGEEFDTLDLEEPDLKLDRQKSVKQRYKDSDLV